MKDNNLAVFAIDFDKISFYESTDCVLRKIAENQYEPRSVVTDKDKLKLLASSFTYDPLPDYPEYNIWSEAYIRTANKFGMGEFAAQVLEFRKKYF